MRKVNLETMLANILLCWAYCLSIKLTKPVLTSLVCHPVLNTVCCYIFTGTPSSSNLPPNYRELDNVVDENLRDNGPLTEDIKEKLESLLDLLVDTTKGASIEMLERYHSVLQCCIHKQRHSHDKKQLLEVGILSGSS